MDEIFRFEITKVQKNRAVKRRVKNESKWKPLLWSSRILLTLSIICFAGSFFVDERNFVLVDTLGFAFAVFLVIGVIMRAFVSAFTARWIKDRLNEQIWVQNGVLNQVFFFSVSGGFAYRIAGDRAVQNIIDLDSINDALYDPDSGRIELCGKSRAVLFLNYRKGIVKSNDQLSEKFYHVFYDYTSPNLYDYLLAHGVNFTKKNIEYSAFDRRP